MIGADGNWDCEIEVVTVAVVVDTVVPSDILVSLISGIVTYCVIVLVETCVRVTLDVIVVCCCDDELKSKKIRDPMRMEITHRPIMV